MNSSQPQAGIYYLVRKNSLSSPQSSIPESCPQEEDDEPFIDDMLLTYKTEILDEITAAINNLPISEAIISPQVLTSEGWSAIPAHAYMLSAQRSYQKCQIITFLREPNEPIPINLSQVRALFEAQGQIKAFIGMMPSNAPLVGLLLGIMSEFGFEPGEETRVTFPEKACPRSYELAELEIKKLEDYDGQVVFAFGLHPAATVRRLESKMIEVVQFVQTDEQVHSLFEERTGPIHASGLLLNRTVSTGAETQNNETRRQGGNGRGNSVEPKRMKQIYHTKSPIEIESIRNQAIVASSTGLRIDVPCIDEAEIKTQLNKLSWLITELLGPKKREKF